MNQSSANIRPSVLAFVLPFLMGTVLAVVVGALVIAGYIGRKPEGGRLTVVFESGCADQWRPIVQSRVDSVGLGEPSLTLDGDRLTLTATFPGLEDDATAVPALLIAEGALGVFVEGEDGEPVGETLATAADISAAKLNLDSRARPIVEVSLNPDARKRVHEASRAGAILYAVNGEVVERYNDKRGLRGMSIELVPELQSFEAEIRAATDWSIMLNHGPAPCPASVVSVTEAG